MEDKKDGDTRFVLYQIVDFAPAACTLTAFSPTHPLDQTVALDKGSEAR